MALKIKTATGIKRFLDDKSCGALLDKLFAIIKTRDSCKPEQAIEQQWHHKSHWLDCLSL